MTKNHQELVFSRAAGDVDKARLLAAASPHSGDWLHAPPIASVDLRLSDEAVRVAVAHRLGCKACEPHTCPCGKAVDARGLHGLCCRRSGPRHQRHHQMNDILEGDQTGSDTGNLARQSYTARRKTSRWHHIATLGTRQAHGMGRHSS